MFDKETVDGHIISVDDEAAVGWVVRPAHSRAVICPPKPEVVAQDIVGINGHAVCRAPLGGPAHPAADIVEADRISGMINQAGARSNLQQRW